jgi:hypothetical protein
MFKKTLFAAKMAPVFCFVVGLGVIGLTLKFLTPIHDHFYYDRNLRKPKTGKTKGL